MSNLIYGLHDMEEYASLPLAEVGITEINDRINMFVSAEERMWRQITDTVVQSDERWNESPINRYNMEYAVDMQPVDEDGVAKPVRAAASYQIGLPLFRREFAIGYTWERARVKTVADLSKDLRQLQQADMTSTFRMMLRALLRETGYTFYSSEDQDDFPAEIPVLPLANADSQTYMGSNGSSATADHYRAQAAGIADATDPFQGIYDRLALYSPVSNPRIVSFVGGATAAAEVKALTAFYPVTNTRYVTPASDQAVLSDSVYQDILFGDQVLGEHDAGVVVVRWDKLPADYVLSINLDAPALGRREHRAPQLRGIYSTNAQGNSGGELLSRFRRQVGFGVVNRTGADVVQVRAGDTTYDVPAGYDVIA